MAARLGQSFGRDVGLTVADLGWSVRLPEGLTLESEDIESLLGRERFTADVLEGLDRGELLARRFRHVATTALMVLRNPENGRRRVGGQFWVSRRLFPLVQALCPDHLLLRETRREVLEDVLDAPAAPGLAGPVPRGSFPRFAPSSAIRRRLDRHRRRRDGAVRIGGRGTAAAPRAFGGAITLITVEMKHRQRSLGTTWRGLPGCLAQPWALVSIHFGELVSTPKALHSKAQGRRRRTLGRENHHHTSLRCERCTILPKVAQRILDICFSTSRR